MKISLGTGWPLCACASLLLALPAAAQVSVAGSKPKFDVLARKVEKHGDHTVTLVRVKPPILPKTPAPAPQPEPTAEEQAIAVRRAGKSYESIALTADVYVGTHTVTELSWMEEGVTYRALSNVDFRLLTQLADVETKDSVYLWFPFVCAAEGEMPDGIGTDDLKKLNPNHADYVFLGSAKEQKSAAKGLDLLDYMHAYAQLNREKLKGDLAKREADELAAEEKRKNSPPPSPVITFWLETGAKR
ncbi:MAG: hypothetical protein HYV96_11075 [Opitutae bacterium]|nr:hypothetical protein [Opitutae bacterium]